MSNTAGQSEGHSGANWSAAIILSGFASVTSLAALFVFYPETAAESIVTTAIGGIIGFIAGRKR